MGRIGIYFFITSMVMFFVIQLLTEYRLLLIESGRMNGDYTFTYFASSLVVIPLILFIISLVLIWSYYKKK